MACGGCLAGAVDWPDCVRLRLSTLLPIDVGIHCIMAAMPVAQNNMTAMPPMITIGWAFCFWNVLTCIFMTVPFLGFDRAFFGERLLASGYWRANIRPPVPGLGTGRAMTSP
jgi:hypothetical protein